MKLNIMILINLFYISSILLFIQIIKSIPTIILIIILKYLSILLFQKINQILKLILLLLILLALMDTRQHKHNITYMYYSIQYSKMLNLISVLHYLLLHQNLKLPLSKHMQFYCYNLDNLIFVKQLEDQKLPLLYQFILKFA